MVKCIHVDIRISKKWDRRLRTFGGTQNLRPGTYLMCETQNLRQGTLNVDPEIKDPGTAHGWNPGPKTCEPKGANQGPRTGIHRT